MISTFTIAMLVNVFLLGGIMRELRMIRGRLGGTVAFLPWNED